MSIKLLRVEGRRLLVHTSLQTEFNKAELRVERRELRGGKKHLDFYL